MDVSIRPAVSADGPACGRIMYEAFQGINEQHGFENVEVLLTLMSVGKYQEPTGRYITSVAF